MNTVFRWFKRMVNGGKGEWENTETVENPSVLLRKAFFRRKAAVMALIAFAALFLFALIAPVFVKLDVNYTDPLQQNVAPTYSLRRMPRRLKKGVAETDGFSDFTVGLSREGEVFVWGNTKQNLSGRDMKKLPEEVKEGCVKIAAGKDHALALTKEGFLVGWGDKSCGQYGVEPVLNGLTMPTSLTEKLNVEEVTQIVCGYQTSGVVFSDGQAHLWGNLNAVRNLEMLSKTLVDKPTEKLAFTNASAVALLKNGGIETGGEKLFGLAVSSKNGRVSDFNSYTVGRKAVEIAANNKCVALVFDDGELLVAGAFENGEDSLPTFQEGERFVKLEGGTRHFIGLTNLGNIYAWGDNSYSQCNLKGVKGANVFAGSSQSYVADGEGRLVKSAGLKGYLMGTDGRGRDVFARIVHGGKMTMTIGAIAVLVSSVIAILVGCTAGYFGGWVDTLLMRITEIFSSIPFLPFAMLLSQIIKNYNVGEGMRIFIIMLILGVLSWTGLARMIRGQVLAEREKEFVLSAKALGVKEGKIAFRHVLLNVTSVILVSMTLDFAGCLLTEASLSYLGFGVQPPTPTWGNMLTGSNNSAVIQYYWWQWLFPALFLSVAVICINVIGDTLRDALDPKTKER